ncbi:UNVERIFIED_CONTAM: Peroxidase 7 [Sesamum calycinum]|uniref:peroxidase n=1 Tax=Sesamum calycinum TaxID=2727403 RepID=A0AAW2Q5C2_9LAMI
MRWFLPTVFLLNLHLAVIAATIIPKQQPLTGRVLPKAKAAPLLPPSAFLSTTYYLKSCPNLESIIQQKVNAWFQKDSTLAASIIRLHFHDCAIRGCDASILLNHPGSERSAEASRTLRGFTVIDDIKAEVERQCQKPSHVPTFSRRQPETPLSSSEVRSGSPVLGIHPSLKKPTTSLRATRTSHPYSISSTKWG